MVDPRIVKLAHILTDYSLKIKKGDTIEIDSGGEARDLILEVCKNILKKGAVPKVNLQLPGFSYLYYTYASPDVLKLFPQIKMYEAEHVDGSISIGTEYNTKELTAIDPKKIALRQKITHPISEVHLKKDNWVLLEYPTNALAQDAEMSLQEFEDFVFESCLQDWPAMEREQEILKQIMDKGEVIRLVAPDTDLTLNIKGRQGIKCCGQRNMPDGEVMIAPVETKVNGHVRFTYPAVYHGKEVDDVYLEFKQGAVVKATAKKNEDFLRAMIATDKGSKYLGEFSIAMNYGIKKFTKNILFDEKIGGSVHMALGMAYKEGGGRNESALHWDMIKDLRKGGAVYIDGKIIQKDGKFTIPLNK